jgi:hypothetical protein
LNIMRTTIYILVISFLFLTVTLQAQKNTFYIGAEIGITHPSIDFTDTGNSAKKGKDIIHQLPIWGGEIGYQHQHFWVELGCYAHDLPLANFNFRASGDYWNSTRGIEIANRYGYDIRLHKIKRFYLSPHLGYRMGITRGLENVWNTYTIDSTYYPVGYRTDVPYYELDYNNGLTNGVYHLLETGLEFSHFVIEQGWRLSVMARYVHGFQRISESRVYYEFPDGRSGDAIFWQNGGYWMGGISLSYYLFKREKF